MYTNGWHYKETMDTETKAHPDLTHFSDLSEKRQRFYRELIYAIPVILNRSGFEVFKPSEQGFIKNELIENLASAIHERYRILMREMDENSKTDSVFEKLYILDVYNRQYFSVEYNQLLYFMSIFIMPCFQ